MAVTTTTAAQRERRRTRPTRPTKTGKTTTMKRKRGAKRGIDPGVETGDEGQAFSVEIMFFYFSRFIVTSRLRPDHFI